MKILLELQKECFKVVGQMPPISQDHKVSMEDAEDVSFENGFHLEPNNAVAQCNLSRTTCQPTHCPVSSTF